MSSKLGKSQEPKEVTQNRDDEKGQIIMINLYDREISSYLV